MNEEQRRAWEAMYRTLGQCLLHLPSNSPLAEMIHASMETAERAESIGRQDPTRYAEHVKHGAGWKPPVKL